MPNELLINCN